MKTDRLDIVSAFENAGFARPQAETVATVIMDAIRDNVATKADLLQVKHDLTVRGLAALITAISVLFAALHYWPPHG